MRYGGRKADEGERDEYRSRKARERRDEFRSIKARERER